MFKKKAKHNRRGSHAYPYTKENMKHVGWCIKNKIEIAVTPDYEGPSENWKVEIRLNRGKYKRDPKSYTYDEAMAKLYNYYEYYYNKYKPKTNDNG